jgi:hypothetical protein
MLRTIRTSGRSPLDRRKNSVRNNQTTCGAKSEQLEALMVRLGCKVRRAIKVGKGTEGSVTM